MTNFIHSIENQLNQPFLLFNDSQTIIRIILSGILIYISLILIFNLFGKRSIANLSMHDYVVTIAMGSIVGSSILSKSATLLDGLVSILILMALQFVVTYLSKLDDRFFHYLNSKPRILFIEGKFVDENMKSNRITQDEVYSAIREQGQTTSDQIFAVLIESNGNLSVIKSATESYKEEITRFL